MIADAHLDLLLELGHRELRLGERGSFARTWLPLLEVGGVGVQVCPSSVVAVCCDNLLSFLRRSLTSPP